MENVTHLCKLVRHNGRRFPNEVTESRSGTVIARGPRMRAATAARAFTPRKLHLLMTTPQDDRPTNPDELRPDSENPDPSSEVMRAAKPVPMSLLEEAQDDGRPLQWSSTPTVLELAAQRILRGVEQLNATDFEAMLKASEGRAADAAREREDARAKTVDSNLELISGEVRGLRVKLEELAPKVTALEDIPRQLAEMRTRMDRLEREWTDWKREHPAPHP